VFNAPFKADLIVITELGSFLMGLPQGERISTIGLAVWRQTHKLTDCNNLHSEAYSVNVLNNMSPLSLLMMQQATLSSHGMKR